MTKTVLSQYHNLTINICKIIKLSHCLHTDTKLSYSAPLSYSFPLHYITTSYNYLYPLIPLI